MRDVVDVLNRTIRMLKGPDLEVRCAAALVLGRLRPVEEKTVRALRRALKAADGSTRSYYLDALAATGRDDVIADIVPYLEVQGSAAEQAVQLVWRFGKKALPAIAARHKDVAGWITGAYLKAVAGIRHKDAVKMVFDRLEHLSWEQARATSLFLRENFSNYSESLRKEFRKHLVALLDAHDPEKNPNAVITGLKLAWSLDGEVPAAVVAPFAARGRPAAVRRHAFQALAGMTPDSALAESLRPTLLGYLEENDEENVALPALEVLASWPSPPTSGELKRLLEARHGAVVEWALHELLRRGDPEGAAGITRLLESGRPAHRTAAISALRELADGGRTALRALENERDDDVRLDMVEALCDRASSLDDATVLIAMEKYFARPFPGSERADRAFIVLFGRRLRAIFNARLQERARQSLAVADHAAAIDLLQPVVRWRQADEETRVLLALANLGAAGTNLVDADPHLQRAAHIIGPLARTMGYDVKARLAGEPLLTPDRRLAVARALQAMGPEEKALALELRAGAKANGDRAASVTPLSS